MRRAERAGRPLTLLLLDIDEFKHQNDSFGHDAGDAVLRELGALLARSLRREDVACRYGGDEFVLVLPDASLDTALRRADEIRETVKGSGVGPRPPPRRAHGSIGLAAFPTTAGAEELLAAADSRFTGQPRPDRVSAVPRSARPRRRATGWPPLIAARALSTPVAPAFPFDGASHRLLARLIGLPCQAPRHTSRRNERHARSSWLTPVRAVLSTGRLGLPASLRKRRIQLTSWESWF